MGTSKGWASALLALLTVGGCTTMPRPRDGWIPDRREAERQSRGGTMTMRVREADRRNVDLTGELLAADHDSVLILTRSGLTCVARDAIRDGSVEFDDVRGTRTTVPLYDRRQGLPSVEDLARFPRTSTVRAREWLAAAAGEDSTR